MPLLLSSNLRPYPLVLPPLPLGVGRYYPSSHILTCLHAFLSGRSSPWIKSRYVFTRCQHLYLVCEGARIVYLWAVYIVFASCSTILVVSAIYLFIALNFPPNSMCVLYTMANGSLY